MADDSVVVLAATGGLGGAVTDALPVRVVTVTPGAGVPGPVAGDDAPWRSRRRRTGGVLCHSGPGTGSRQARTGCDSFVASGVPGGG